MNQQKKILALRACCLSSVSLLKFHKGMGYVHSIWPNRTSLQSLIIFLLLLFRHREYGFRTRLMNPNMKYTLKLMQSLQELHLLLTLQQVNFNGKDFLAVSYLSV